MRKKHRVVFEFTGDHGFSDMEAFMNRNGTTLNDYVVATVLVDGDLREMWIPKVNDLPKRKTTALTGT